MRGPTERRLGDAGGRLVRHVQGPEPAARPGPGLCGSVAVAGARIFPAQLVVCSEEVGEGLDETEEPRKAVVAIAAASRSFRLWSLWRSLEGEQVAVGWPPWHSAVAGEAIQGWIPLKADSLMYKDIQMIFFRLKDLDLPNNHVDRSVLSSIRTKLAAFLVTQVIDEKGEFH